MNQPGSKLTALQRALQQSGLKQLEAVKMTLTILKAMPASQADREVITDSLNWLAKSDDCLRNWFGGVPAEFAGDIAATGDET